jgi:hypothetical protein
MTLSGLPTDILAQLPSNEGGTSRLVIVAIDGPIEPLIAQYSPNQISIDKSVPWNKHKNPKGDVPMLEFTNAENRTLSLELFFDASEPSNKGDVLAMTKKLTDMTMINAQAAKESEKHPPRVLLVFGYVWFRGVVESLQVKYTMFSRQGIPVRATCALKIKEVDAVQAGGDAG